MSAMSHAESYCTALTSFHASAHSSACHPLYHAVAAVAPTNEDGTTAASITVTDTDTDEPPCQSRWSLATSFGE